MPKGSFDLQTIGYLAVMPALNEELVYRGLLLGFLNSVFPRKWEFLRAYIGWGVIIVTLLFALLHGIWLDYRLQLNISIVPLLSAAVSGFIFGWLRERTKSLVFPMIAHSAWNLFFFLPRMI